MYEIVVAMHVTDEVGYRAYREAMMPILASFGGGFRFDFRVSETLSEAPDHPVNRAFAIGFPDRETCDRFFADEAYLAVKKAHYEGSVGRHTVLAAYER